MIPAGYMAKRVAAKPRWLNSPDIVDIYSVSTCISKNFADYIPFFRHNGYWLFDTTQKIQELAGEQSLDLSETQFFYYEVHPQQFDEDRHTWESFVPEASFVTEVKPPATKKLEGFDVVTFSAGTSTECSPLTCNGLADSICTTQHGLLPSLDEARRLLEAGFFDRSEPGPFRIFAIYTFDQV